MVELLAPAGSYETILAAFRAGADAVYTGGSRFGARAYAQNLSEEELLAAIDYAHLHGKKIYLTINTLFKEEELQKELYPYLLPYYQQGLDGVIVQDLGVMAWMKKNFPLLPLHVSTQAVVTGPYSAKTLEEMGACRVVPARELSLEEIRQIHKETNLEIETFIHGALCYCYSGQCLFSSMLGGRSGNRGRCAQPCRLPYQLYQNGKKLSRPGQEYLLSPKDICTVDLLPEIIAAGVTSLKIEGRMKRAEYTAGVVSIYRKYLDACLAGKPKKLSKEDRAKLMLLFNRDGFSDGYYKVRNGREMIALLNAKEKEREQKEIAVKREALYADIKKQVEGKNGQEKIKGILKLFPGTPAILELYCKNRNVTVWGDEVQYAKSHPLARERIHQQMTKTGNTPFVFEQLDIMMEDPVFLPMQSMNALRREGLSQLEEEVLRSWKREIPLKVQTESSECDDARNLEKRNAPRWMGQAETAEQLKVLLEYPDLDVICDGYSIQNRRCFPKNAIAIWEQARSKGKTYYLALPHMTRHQDLDELKPAILELADLGVDGFLVRTTEALGFMHAIGFSERTILDSSVYTFNSASQKVIHDLGVKMDSVPMELNYRELINRDNRNSQMLVYGRTPLMISAQCLAKTTKGCDKQSGIYHLTDRKGTDFCVKCQCGFCYNIIYNSVPTSLLTELDAVKKLGAKLLKLSFTVERAEETERVLKAFLSRETVAEENQKKVSYTKGHFRRGVE